MNTRERFVRTLTGQAVDRVPFIKVFGGDNSIVPAWEQECPGIGKRIDRMLQFEGGYRGWRSTRYGTLNLINVAPPTVVSEDDEKIFMRYGHGQVNVKYKHGGFANHIVEYPVKTPADWARIKERHLPSVKDLAKPLPAAWQKQAEEYRARDYPLQLTHGGVYGFARNMLGDEALALAFYDEPAMVHDLMDTYTDLCLAAWSRVVRDVPFDLVECWEDMASKNGPIISPQFFREFMAPNYRKIRAFADAHNIKIVLVDSDGNIEALVPLMLEAGVTAMYPFEVKAGNDLLGLLRRHPALGAIGGLEKNSMAEGQKAVESQMERARALIRQGRAIPGPDHFVLADVTFAQYRYFMERLREVVLTTRPGG